uniref:Uncharacterized protein n=1 Tax=Anguilla anguilla TaxID=7936 RepID=A0A0E9UQG6_ANGAN
MLSDPEASQRSSISEFLQSPQELVLKCLSSLSNCHIDCFVKGWIALFVNSV